MKVIIGIAGGSYVLEGDIDAIRNKRGVRSNFVSIGADVNLEGKIVVPFSTELNPTEHDDKEEQYKAIKRLLNKHGIKYSKTKHAEKFLRDLDDENKRFIDFSLKAKNIRNNLHEGNDFINFTNLIANKFKRKLYTLQLLSAYHLAFSQNACNFSVPGAGKTSIVYGAYTYLKNLSPEDSKHVDRLLIISPLSAFAPWRNEYVECIGKKPSVALLLGSDQDSRQKHFYSDGYTEITLISYQSASSNTDIEHITAYLKRYRVMLVLDEAHRIKKEGGKWADAMLSIAKYATSRVVLTGTPAPNGYQDLHNLYKFIWPNESVINFPVHYLKQLTDDSTPRGEEDVRKLINNIAPFFMRIKKSNLNLPNPVENEPLIVPMNKTQREIYDYIEKAYISYFERESTTGDFKSNLKQAKLIRLMQCTTNPSALKKPLDDYLEGDDISRNLNIDDSRIIKLIRSYNDRQEVPVKFIKSLELIKKITKKKGADGRVIIWSIFIKTIEDLKEYLESQDVDCELLYGGTPNEIFGSDKQDLTREKIIQKFHEDDCPYKVIVANPSAVGESISLHKACHSAIYLEKNFNAATYMQSKDRIHRYGLRHDDVINYYHLLSEDSIDSVIHSRVLEKEERMLKIIESEEIPLLDMNKADPGDDDDIHTLIRDYHVRKGSPVH